MDGILPVSLDVLAPSAIAGIAVLAVLTGRLVPRRTYEDQVDRANQWMAEARLKDQQLAVKDEQIGEKDKQLGHMAEVGRMVQAIMSAIQVRAGGDDKAAS